MLRRKEKISRWLEERGMMFIGDFEKSVSWSHEGVKGCRRFLERVWKLQSFLVDGDEPVSIRKSEI